MFQNIFRKQAEAGNNIFLRNSLVYGEHAREKQLFSRKTLEQNYVQRHETVNFKAESASPKKNKL